MEKPTSSSSKLGPISSKKPNSKTSNTHISNATMLSIHTNSGVKGTLPNYSGVKGTLPNSQDPVGVEKKLETSSKRVHSKSSSDISKIRPESIHTISGENPSVHTNSGEKVSPLTYKDADGVEWFLRGSVTQKGQKIFDSETPIGLEDSSETRIRSPPIGPPQKAIRVDRYGFVVGSHKAMEEKEMDESRTEQTREEKQIRKWRSMAGSGGSDWKRYAKKKPRQLKRRIRKGIPDCLRGLLWQLISGSRDLLLRNQGVYQQLVFYETSSAELDIIRDINRTFPSHVFFQQRHGPGQRSLYNVLKAYSVYDREVGYVQGMGFLAGLFLLYMGEEDAFWLLVALLKGVLHTPMEGLYQVGLPLVQQQLWQFDRLLHEQLPELAAHMDKEMITPSMYGSQWFITIFTYSFPFSTALRIWDVFLLEGMSVVFRVGLALLKFCEQDLLQQPFEDLIHKLRRFPTEALQPATLLPLAFSFKISKRLEELRLQYQEMQNPSPSPPPPPPPPSPSRISNVESERSGGRGKTHSGSQTPTRTHSGLAGFRAAMKSVVSVSAPSSRRVSFSA